MFRSLKSIRGLVAIGLAVGLAAACGNSSSTGNPGPGNAADTKAGGGGGSSLTSGLSSNLDNLDSYQFSWTLSGPSTGDSGASPGNSGSFGVTGTVINRPAKAFSVNDLGVRFIDIGAQEWTSYDGTTWNGPTAVDSNLTDMLPSHDYATWFDTNSTYFTSSGTETKNGVQCIHYKGNSSLGALYGVSSGVSASFQADLWVATSGDYPVSGVYGFAASSGSQAGAFYYSFDITHINDASNEVAAPTNVVAIPT